MSEGFDHLRLRREALVRHSEWQREELKDQLQRIRASLDGVDRGLMVVRRLATPPMLVVGGVMVTLLLGRGRTKRALAAGVALLGLLLRVRSTGQLLLEAAQGKSSAVQPVRRSR